MTKEELCRKTAGNIVRFCKKNSTLILGVLSVAGLAATVVTLDKAAKEADEKIKSKMLERNGEDLTVVEKIQVAGPSYVVPMIFASATAACIICNSIKSNNAQKSLIGAYSMLDASYTNYRKTLVELHGEEADKEVMDAMAVRNFSDFHQLHIDIPDQKCIWYDPMSGNSIVAYEREIMDAEYHLNRNFTLAGTATLNDFYQMVGLPLTDQGANLGWTASDGYMWIDVEHRLIPYPGDDGDDLPCYSIDFIFCPTPDYLEDWL